MEEITLPGLNEKRLVPLLSRASAAYFSQRFRNCSSILGAAWPPGDQRSEIKVTFGGRAHDRCFRWRDKYGNAMDVRRERNSGQPPLFPAPILVSLSPVTRGTISAATARYLRESRTPAPRKRADWPSCQFSESVPRTTKSTWPCRSRVRPHL
jgi:hypothetical protein